MIFVTVGMHYRGFDRLVKKMDEIAPSLDEEVVMQIGNAEYLPKNVYAVKFLDNNNMKGYYNDASLIISHGGAGTLIEAISAQKPLIIVPRMKQYGEVIDDQQNELAMALSEIGLVKVVYDTEKLAATISSIRSQRYGAHKKGRDLVHFLKRELIEGEN